MIAVALIEKLIQDRINIIAVIRPNTRNLYRLPKSNFIEILECDVKNILNLRNKINMSIDIFFHFAWEESTQNRNSNIYSQIMNIKYTIDCYKLASELKCYKFIGSGSQSEYGINSTNVTLDENTIPNPYHPYGIAKLTTSKLLLNLAENNITSVIWARVFSVYGKNDHSHTLISNLLRLKDGDTFEVNSSDNYWDYLNEEDAAEAFYLLAKKGKDNQIYNIASGESKPLKIYVEKIINLLNKKINIIFSKNNINSKINLNTSIKKIKDETGFYPKIKFENGIINILKYIEINEENIQNEWKY